MWNDLEPATIPAWDAAQALAKLEISEVSFESTNGNVMGFASGRTIAVSPLNAGQVLGGTNALEHFCKWKAPEER